MAAGAERGVDSVEHRLCLLDAAVRHEPARRFRQPQAHEEDDEAEHRPDQERQAPAQIRRQQVGIEQHERACRAQRGANPKAAVDDEIAPAAIACRHQLLDAGIDRGVFAADAGAGEEAKQGEARQIPRQRGRGGGDEVDAERDEEQPLASEPVREPAEEERAEHRAGEIGAASKPNIGVGEFKVRALFERGRDGAGERHLKPIEDPGDAERDHDQRVEAAPAQPIEPRWNVGRDDRRACLRRRVRCDRDTRCHPRLIVAPGER